MVELNQIRIAFFDLEEKYIHDLITQCQQHSIELCLVSLASDSVNSKEKLTLAKNTYDTSFEVCSAPSIELALAVMETMAKLRGYNVSEVLFVSTDIKSTELAKQKGFWVLNDLTEDFKITPQNRYRIGCWTGTTDLIIPAVFYNKDDDTLYRVTKIGQDAFFGCNMLISVVIPNTVTVIETDAFYCRRTLKSVIIPKSVNKICSCAFDNCISLSELRIPSSVTSIGQYAFDNCISLTELRVPSSITYIGDYAFNKVPKVVYNGTITGSPWGAFSVVPE